MENKKTNIKILPPPPFPPLLLIQELSKMDRLPIYQPNRDIYSDVTLSLNNLVNVEKYIRNMNFEREKEYDKKSEMCKDFKQKEEKKQGFFNNILNNLNPLNALQKTDSKKQKNKKIKSNTDKEDNNNEDVNKEYISDNTPQDNKLPKGTIILDNIDFSNEIDNKTDYKKYILEWYNN